MNGWRLSVVRAAGKIGYSIGFLTGAALVYAAIALVALPIAALIYYGVFL